MSDEVMTAEIKERNRKLCERYPFLIPANPWTGVRMTCAGFWPDEPERVPEYDYEYTELDDMPDGWRIAFGEQMCEEIREALLKHGGEEALDRYRIAQIKEKFGALRWYDFDGNEDTDAVIDKYEAISERTCIQCGKPAWCISTWWISPWCEECAKTVNGEVVPIDKGACAE